MELSRVLFRSGCAIGHEAKKTKSKVKNRSFRARAFPMVRPSCRRVQAPPSLRVFHPCRRPQMLIAQESAQPYVNSLQAQANLLQGPRLQPFQPADTYPKRSEEHTSELQSPIHI